MKTLYTVEIEHDKPLPTKVMDVLSDELANRAYGLIHVHGGRCGAVEAKLEPSESAEQPVKGDGFLRCLGHGVGPSGHQIRVDCVGCVRRTAPRAGAVFIDPPSEFPCPKRIGE